jgi:pilus assembly protein CpaC
MKPATVVACALLAALGPIAPAMAQTRAAVSMGAAPQLINLPRGTSFAVDLPADARDVIVSNPQVAEAMLHRRAASPSSVWAQAKPTPCSWTPQDARS